MGKIQFFSNLCLRRNPKSLPLLAAQIRNQSLGSVQLNKVSEESTQHRQNLDSVSESSSSSQELMKTLQNEPARIREVAREVSKFFRTRARWEQELLHEFPGVNFADPVIYNAVLRRENNAFLSLRFYQWLRSLNVSLFDQDFCNVLFGRLVADKAMSAAKNLLDKTEFDPEPQYLELYIRCLCENGLFDEAFDMFAHLRSIGYNVSLETWNLALSHSVRCKRVDVVWRLHGYVMECGVVSDVNTIGHLIQAFCLDNNAKKGYELLQQVLAAGHVPSRTVFVYLVSALCKNGNYGRVVAVLNYMIAKNVPPDIDVYHEIIKTLCNSRMIDEGFRIFNELKDRGYFPDRAMYTTMIWGLCTYKDVGDARKLWCEMIQNKMVPDECAYNAFIDGLFNRGCVDEAEKLYEEMLAEGIRETTKTYNTMINGLGLNSKVEEARALFETMHEKGIRRDSSTYNSLIKGFLRQGNLTEGTYFLNELLKHGFQPTNSSFTMLIEKLCEAGHVKEAATLWLEMRNRGLEGEGDHLLEPIVEGLTKQGCVEEAIERLGYMISVGLRPKNAILEGLVRADKFGDGSFLFLGYMVKMGVCSLNRLSVIVRSKKLRIEKVERRGGVFS